MTTEPSAKELPPEATGADPIAAPPEVEIGRVGSMPEIGDVNVLEASIGKKEHGKSTWQVFRAWELQREYGGAYVIGHSLGRRLPRELPPELTGGHKVTIPLVYHKSIEKLERGLRKDPSKWHILAPPLPEEGGDPDSDTADDLLHFSARLAFAVRQAAWRKEHPLGRWGDGQDVEGLRATPVIVIMDEGIAVEAASTGGKSRGNDRWFLQYCYGLRHMHIVLLYAIQEPTSRSWRILESATTIYIFRLQHEWALGAIRACGADEEMLVQIRNLPPYEKVKIV